MLQMRMQQLAQLFLMYFQGQTQSTNGTGVSTGKPSSPAEANPPTSNVATQKLNKAASSSRRRRSKTAAAADVPRSKFEHSV